MQILESKGGIGVPAHPKSQVTAPKEFRFCTDVRLGPPSVADLFDKVFIDSHIIITIPFFGQDLIKHFPILQLSLHSECSSNGNRQDVPRSTIPNPFNLQTEVCEMWSFFRDMAFLIMFAQQNNYAPLVAGKRSFERETARSTALTKEDGGGKG